MDCGYVVGWLGIAFGVAVPLPQLKKIITTRSMKDVSISTYIFLCIAMVCYLSHAIYIKSPVFITAQTVNLTTNSIVLFLLVRGRQK